jgi:hypothetical protein
MAQKTEGELGARRCAPRRGGVLAERFDAFCWTSTGWSVAVSGPSPVWWALWQSESVGQNLAFPDADEKRKG